MGKGDKDSSAERVLIVGSTRVGSLEGAYVRAFRQLQVPVVEQFDLEAPASALARNRIIHRFTALLQDEIASRALFHFLKGRTKRYTLIIVVKGLRLIPTWLEKSKARTTGTVWLNINPDDPFNRHSRGASSARVRGSIRAYDIYAIWSANLISAIHAAGGIHVLHLPFGFDPDEHYPAETVSAELKDAITFVGAWDRQREETLTAVADLPLRIFGYGWDRIGRQSPLRGKVQPCNIYGADLRRVITSSRASLNILRPQNRGAHNMRTFEIPAMRGLMVTTRSPEQAGYFPERQACLMYDDLLELRQVLHTIGAGEINVDDMRAAARANCHGHSYTDRAGSLLAAVARYRRDGQIA